jgi:hypothetical protein
MRLRYKILDEKFNLSDLDFTDKDGKDCEKVQWFIRKYALKHQQRNLGITRVILFKKVIPKDLEQKITDNF